MGCSILDLIDVDALANALRQSQAAALHEDSKMIQHDTALVLQIPWEKVFRHPKPTRKPLAKENGASEHKGKMNEIHQILMVLNMFEHMTMFNASMYDIFTL